LWKEREREREREIYVCIYIYVCVYGLIHTYVTHLIYIRLRYFKTKRMVTVAFNVFEDVMRKQAHAMVKFAPLSAVLEHELCRTLLAQLQVSLSFPPSLDR
jgi:hypothetical protein